LVGSPYKGPADYIVNSDNFSVATDAVVMGIEFNGKTSFIIHGNDNANILVGGTGNDNIHAYGGDDIIYGGDETCSGDCSGQQIGDRIFAGQGNDTIYGGNESCPKKGAICDDHSGTTHIGDFIVGGGQNDLIFGGDESCAAQGNSSYEGCSGAGTQIGDIIQGSNHNDTIIDGTSTCTGTGCTGPNAPIIGDSVDGGAGTDVCNSSGDSGDTEVNCEI
jgi:Ca2+-binding RTX toxin-like protein